MRQKGLLDAFLMKFLPVWCSPWGVLWSKEHSPVKNSCFKITQNLYAFLKSVNGTPDSQQYYLIFFLFSVRLQLLFHPFFQNSWRSCSSPPIQANFYTYSSFILFFFLCIILIDVIFSWFDNVGSSLLWRVGKLGAQSRMFFFWLRTGKSGNTSGNNDTLMIFVASPSF